MPPVPEPLAPIFSSTGTTGAVALDWFLLVAFGLVAPILIDTGLIFSSRLGLIATSSRTISTDFQQYRNNWSSRLGLVLIGCLWLGSTDFD